MLFHAVAINAISLDFTQHPVANKEYFDALDLVLKPYSLNRYYAIFGVMGAVFIILPLEQGYDKWLSNRPASYALDKPASIKVDSLLDGKVVVATKLYKKIKNHQERTESVDSGMRLVIFKFTKLYPYPVYVSLRYHQSAYPEATLEKLKRLVANTQSITLKVNADYTISIADERLLASGTSS
ncbi:hypothetical protein F9L16_23845 [Agarivorans sp. B2Z047]|uniref:hypothetical protein n=1 Tax=Agarivorans sp. B2Z047 TaxID=2652721 RepID=UPI00128C5822|nr:hypothetical protein [Agarivorans sp. B2Z047]MPW31983.1 hypothetical protein [Agarivorans sp. B2Z047]UQN41955.1 hypothetical protein LQZ07_19585 [Agarivorans sp. B2Z047]